MSPLETCYELFSLKYSNTVDRVLSPQSRRCVSIINKSFKLSNISIHSYLVFEYFFQKIKETCIYTHATEIIMENQQYCVYTDLKKIQVCLGFVWIKFSKRELYHLTFKLTLKKKIIIKILCLVRRNENSSLIYNVWYNPAGTRRLHDVKKWS